MHTNPFIGLHLSPVNGVYSYKKALKIKIVIRKVAELKHHLHNSNDAALVNFFAQITFQQVNQF